MTWFGVWVFVLLVITVCGAIGATGNGMSGFPGGKK